MEPINYNIDVKSPIENAVSGLQAGLQMQQGMMQIEQLKQQQAAQRQMQLDLANLSSNKNATAQDYASMMVKYPQLSEHFKRSFDVLNGDQQQSMVSDATQAYAALQSGKPDIAVQLLNDKAAAYENGGNAQQAGKLKAFAKLIEINPSAAKTSTALMLSSVMGADKFATTFSTLGDQQRAQDKAPAELAKANADASVAESNALIKSVEATNAPTKTQLENTKAAADIEATRLKQQIDALDVQIKQANSETDRGRLQLERDKLNGELQMKLGAQQSDTQNQLDTVNNSLSTVNGILKHPIMQSSFGVGSTIGKMLGAVPGTDNKDFNAMLDTLKSQQFLTAAKEMKGMGALSDAEGARIERAVASLDRDQSPAAFKTALTTIKTTLERAQAKIVGSGKLPQSGGAFVMQHPVYGVVNDGTINKLLAQFPGATREQVINYLKQSGGK